MGTVTASDGDGDSLTYSITAGNDNGIFAIDSSTGKITIADGSHLDFETTSKYDLTVEVSDSFTGNNAIVTVNITDANDAPEINNQTFSIAEDVVNGITVGIVTSSDADGDSLTYSITAGNDNGIFAINPTTGRITIADGSPLDFETTSKYDLTVEVRDSLTETSASVTVNITDANDAPEINAQTFSIGEDVTNETEVGTVTASDGDGDSLTYSITAGNDNGIFAIDSSTGEITIADGSQLDFESISKYELTVEARDSLTRKTAIITVNITDANEAPEFSSTAPTNATQDLTYTYNVVANDPDANDKLTITAPTLPAWLTLTDNEDGTATLSGTPDNSEIGDYTVELQVKDAAGVVHSQNFTLKVKNTNDIPTISGTPTTTVDEDNAYSFVPTANDIDGDGLSFSIQNKPLWAIFDSATGKLSGTPKNEDVGITQNIVVSVSDGTATVALDAFSLEVINTNDTPEINNQTFNIAENVINGTEVGTVIAKDADGDSLTYKITQGNDNGIFGIDATTGKITIANNSKLDFETTSKYDLTVEVSDSITGETATVTVNITNTNDIPEINDQTFSVGENVSNGTAVGTVIAKDADGDSLTYKITKGNDNGIFGIDATTGKITIANNSKLDFETTSKYDLTVEVSDSITGKSSAVSINIINTNDAPEINDQTFSVGENVVNGTAVGTVLAKDADGDSLTYKITKGNNNGIFGIDATTGKITIANNSKLDFETTSKYDLTVEVSDSITGKSAIVAVNITNANDAPEINDQTFSVGENVVNGTAVGTVLAKDADGDSLTYKITKGNESGIFGIDAATGKITIANNSKLDFETTSKYDLTVEVSDSITGKSAIVAVNITNTNDAPSSINLSNNKVDENALGAIIGNLSTVDVDSYEFTYNISDPRFEVVNNQLKLKKDIALDYEGESVVNLNITATDNGQSAQSLTQAFAVQVGDKIDYKAGDILNGLDTSLTLLQESINQSLLKADLPIADDLKTVLPGFLKTISDNLKLSLKPGQTILDSEINSVFEQSLGKKFPNIKVTSQLGLQESTFLIELSQTYKNGVPLEADLGWDNFGFNVAKGSTADGTFTYKLNLGFGVSKQHGFYLDTKKSSLALDAQVGLNDQFKLQADLGLLQTDFKNSNPYPTKLVADLDVQLKDLDNLPSSSSDGDRLTLDEIKARKSTSDLFSTTFKASANIGVETDVSLDGNVSYPSFGFDVHSGNFTVAEYKNGQWSNLPNPRYQVSNLALDLGDYFNNFSRGVTDGLKGNLKDIPILGNVSSYVPDLQSIINKVLTEINTNAQITFKQGKTLTESEIEVLLKKSLGGTFGNIEVDADLGLDGSTYLLKLGNSFSENVALDADLGLPGFKLAIDNGIIATGTFGYNLTLGFGTNKTDGFYFDTNQTLINFGADASLNSGFKARGELGFMQLDLTDNPNNKTSVEADVTLKLNDPNKDGRLTQKEIGSTQSSLFTTEMTADTNIGLKAVTSLGGQVALPKFNFDLAVDFPALKYVDGKNTSGSLTPSMALNNVQLDLGSFLTDVARPIVDKIDTVVDPIRTPVNALTTNISPLYALEPIRNYLNSNGDNKVTLADIADTIGKANGKNPQISQKAELLNTTLNIIDQVDRDLEQSQASYKIDFGNFQIGNFDPSNPKADSTQARQSTTSKTAISPKTAAERNSSVFSKLNQLEGLSFPVLEPQNAVNFLLGKRDVSLFAYKVPDLNFDFSTKKDLDIFSVYVPWPLDKRYGLFATIGSDFGANVNLGFGFDTKGFYDWKGANYIPSQSYKVFDGFYISDRENADGTGKDIPELEVNADLYIQANLDASVWIPWPTIKYTEVWGVNVPYPSFEDRRAGVNGYAKGGLIGNVKFDLIDGGEDANSGGDGKIRASEVDFNNFSNNYALKGDIDAYLQAAVEAHYIVGSKKWDIINQRFDLIDFNLGAVHRSRAIDGYIAAGEVFFDANLNGVQDPYEPFSITEADGSFALQIDLAEYDLNQNGVLDHTEGKFIVKDGIDISTGLSLDTPLSSVPGSEVVTPLTTVIAELAVQSDPTVAQTRVKAALGIPADINLFTYDPLEAITQADSNGLKVFANMVQVQNIIVQTSKFVGAGSELPLSQVANVAIAAIAQQFQNSEAVDLSDPETITAIMSSTITAMSSADPNINAEQLNSVAATAAEVMALGNGLIDELVASGRPLTDISSDIARLQAISVGQIAVDLPELAAGTVTVDDFLAANTVESIKAKAAEAIVNDPTFRPELVEYSPDDSAFTDTDDGTVETLPGQSDLITAFNQVMAALGLPEGIDLSSEDAVEAFVRNDPNGVAVFAKMVQFQAILDQASMFVGAGGEYPLSALTNIVISAIAEQVQNGETLDLSDPDTIAAIVNSTITTVSSADPSIDAEQLNSVAGTATQVMALTNQLIEEQAASGRPLTEILTDIARLQAVSAEKISTRLQELATGKLTSDEFLEANSIEAIKAEAAEVVIDSDNPEGSTGGSSDSANPGSSPSDLVQGSVIGSGTSQPLTSSGVSGTSEINGFDPTRFVPQIMSPVQPVMVQMSATSTEPTTESDMIMGNGVEVMYLLNGHDTLIADESDNWINGNQGNDMIDVGAGNDTVHGGKDNDTVFSSAGNDWINGNKGDDFLDGSEGTDTLYGGQNGDTLQGQSGNDWLSGNLGSDFLDGGEGTDTLFGGQDGDTLQGGSDNDEVFGNIGADLIEGNEANDLLHGGQNNDTVSGNQGNDTLYGDMGNDIVDGNEGNDLIFGGEGDDTLDGGEGDDELTGGNGNDLLLGAEGNDTLTGEAGNDRFVLSSGVGSDLITDFTDGEDIIVLDGGLTFDQLTLTQNNGSTLIELNSELLATLDGVNIGLITADDFTTFAA